MPPLLSCLLLLATPAQTNGLLLHHDGHFLEIRGEGIPGGPIRINYLEAYCRAGSTDADWVKHTVIPHTCQRLSAPGESKVIRLRDTLADGLEVEHTITAHADHVAFDLVAKNPTAKRSEAHWAQPCVRLGPFTGCSRASPAACTAISASVVLNQVLSAKSKAVSTWFQMTSPRC